MTKPGSRPPGPTPATTPATTPGTNEKPLAANPFAALAGLKDALPPGAPPPAAAPSPSGPPPVLVAKGPARAVVRYERAGRRGKEATLVEKLGLRPAELDAWCRALKQALGCGGAVDGDAIVLQGDQRGRAPAVLEARGVRKVTVS